MRRGRRHSALRVRGPVPWPGVRRPHPQRRAYRPDLDPPLPLQAAIIAVGRRSWCCPASSQGQAVCL
eukprot:11401891-Alexandrium_andersonii.AAC.1